MLVFWCAGMLVTSTKIPSKKSKKTTTTTTKKKLLSKKKIYSVIILCIPNKGRLEGNAYIIINVYYQTKGIEGRQANKYSRKMRRVYVPKYFKPING